MKGLNMYKILNLIFFKRLFFWGYLTFNPLLPQSRDYLEKAVSAIEAGLFKEALNQLDIAQLKNPNNAEVYKLKGLLHEAINENNKAITAWKNCINNTKDSDLINEATIHLKNLQED